METQSRAKMEPTAERLHPRVKPNRRPGAATPEPSVRASEATHDHTNGARRRARACLGESEGRGPSAKIENAEDRIRTYTLLRAPAPQAGASASSATSAQKRTTSISRMGGFYEDRVLPHLINLAMNTEGLRNERRRCSRARGWRCDRGSGVRNRTQPPLLSPPRSPRSSASIRRPRRRGWRANGSRRRCFPSRSSASPRERLPIGDESASTIVSTFTLCTIPDVGQALRDMRRVLRPGGRLHFVEHGRSDDEKMRRWQRRLNGFQQERCSADAIS